MKIAVDIDEVCVKLVERFLDFYREKTEIKFEFEEVVNYHFEEVFGISEQEERELFSEFFNSKYFENLELIEGCKESLSYLSKQNEIVFVTARPIKIKDKTERLIFDNFQFPLRIRYSSDYFGRGKISKLEICRQEQIGTIIEDRGNIALECAEKGIEAFLFDKPWNRNFNGHVNLIRVYNWEEVLKEIGGGTK